MLRTHAPLRTAAQALMLAVACALVMVLPAGAAEGWEDDDDRERRFDRSVPTPVLDAAGPVRAGEVVTIRWQAANHIEECELLLSIDGGRTFDLRISPEIEGLENEYQWRVPNLNAHRARLRMRARVDGREVEGPVGVEFAIEADPGKPREAWLFREGGRSEEVEGVAAPSSLSSPRRAAEIHAPDSSAAVRPEELQAFELPVTSTAPWLDASSSTRFSAGPQLDSQATRFVPLRE